MSAKAFDPVVYKETTRKQWQDAAAAWDRWSEVIDRWLGPATEVMLDMAGIREGSRVLDVAAGAGGQSLAAARRVGPGGSVLATDIASNLLRFAAERRLRDQAHVRHVRQCAQAREQPVVQGRAGCRGVVSRHRRGDRREYHPIAREAGVDIHQAD